MMTIWWGKLQKLSTNKKNQVISIIIISNPKFYMLQYFGCLARLLFVRLISRKVNFLGISRDSCCVSHTLPLEVGQTMQCN